MKISSKNMKKAIARKPWLLVVAAFVLLISAWTVLICVAVKNRPEEVPLESGDAPGEGAADGEKEN